MSRRIQTRDLTFCLVAGVFALSSSVYAAAATTPQKQVARMKFWEPRHLAKIAMAKKQKQIDLVMIGDSITHGWEKGGRDVWKEYYTERNAFNLGFSADRTEQVLWRLQNGAVDGMAPKLIVIMIGTNNTAKRHKPQEIAEGIKMIIGECQERMPKAKILLLAIFARGATASDPRRKSNDKVNEIIAAYAGEVKSLATEKAKKKKRKKSRKSKDEKKVYFLDINQRFLKGNGELSKDIMPDLLHPNGNGYKIWAEAMEPVIAELMGEK